MQEVVIPNEPLPDRFEKLFYQLLDTLDRQAQERQILIKEKEELNKLTQLLINQTKEIGQYEQGIRKRIQGCIQSSAEDSLTKISAMMAEKNNEIVNQYIKQTTKINNSIESTVTHFRTEKTWQPWTMLAIAIISSMITSVVTFSLLHKSIQPLSDQQLSALHAGETLINIWPKLSNKEQEKLKILSNKLIMRSN